MNTQDLTTEQLLSQAAEWRLISLLFDCPNAEWRSQVAELALPLTDRKLKRAAKAAQKEASEGLFHSVFGPGGPAPGREISYRGWVQPGYMLSELSSFYEAFSYKPKTMEVPDHVAVETGFIAYMRFKEAFAVASDDAESAAITADASKKFIDEHLSKFAQQMSKILSASGIEYLSLAGEALYSRVGRDKDMGKQRFLPVLDKDVEEDDMECGLA